MSSSTAFSQRLIALMSMPENQVCCDCIAKRPTWACIIVPPIDAPPQSKEFGGFCCFQCADIHRDLGTHISFVRSIDMEEWDESDVVAMEFGGNKAINDIFEASKEMTQNEKPNESSDLKHRRLYIQNKYEHRKYYDRDAFYKCGYSKIAVNEMLQHLTTTTTTDSLKSPTKKNSLLDSMDNTEHLMKNLSPTVVHSSIMNSVRAPRRTKSGDLLEMRRLVARSKSKDSSMLGKTNESFATMSMNELKRELRRGRRKNSSKENTESQNGKSSSTTNSRSCITRSKSSDLHELKRGLDHNVSALVVTRGHEKLDEDISNERGSYNESWKPRRGAWRSNCSWDISLQSRNVIVSSDLGSVQSLRQKLKKDIGFYIKSGDAATESNSTRSGQPRAKSEPVRGVRRSKSTDFPHSRNESKKKDKGIKFDAKKNDRNNGIRHNYIATSNGPSRDRPEPMRGVRRSKSTDFPTQFRHSYEPNKAQDKEIKSDADATKNDKNNGIRDNDITTSNEPSRDRSDPMLGVRRSKSTDFPAQFRHSCDQNKANNNDLLALRRGRRKKLIVSQETNEIAQCKYSITSHQVELSSQSDIVLSRKSLYNDRKSSQDDDDCHAKHIRAAKKNLKTNIMNRQAKTRSNDDESIMLRSSKKPIESCLNVELIHRVAPETKKKNETSGQYRLKPTKSSDCIIISKVDRNNPTSIRTIQRQLSAKLPRCH